MNETIAIPNEQAAEAAFNEQAPIFDELYSGNTIIQYKRERVRAHLNQYIAPSSQILELNSGTGDDAVYFAKKGHYVHATDISPAMQSELRKKITHFKLEEKISRELRSYTDLANLFNRGPYDVIFSNFAGLNCTKELGSVLSSFPHLLKPGGLVTLVILPQFCLWEFLLLFRGKFRTAFRRFSGKNGAKAHIEGKYFHCWYYNPGHVQKKLGNSFELVKLEGLCSFVPPSYMEGFAEKHPRLYDRLKKMEQRFKSKWPWKSVGDYYIITLRKK